MGLLSKLSKIGNVMGVIYPYRAGGLWVFDDPVKGLFQEPFVLGIPEMIDKLVENIPNADKGFQLTLSNRPFPGYQKTLKWIKKEFDGNWYKTEEEPVMEGWLCSALYLYVPWAPKRIYIKADPIPTKKEDKSNGSVAKRSCG
jgi:hypothetical protein